MQNGKGSVWAVILVVILLLACVGSCSSDSDDEYRKTLESGQQKYYSGQEMTREEYNAVKSFNKWKENQGPKTYSDWDN